MAEIELSGSPTVSIVIVNWNGERLLPHCLEAVAAQEFKDFETIVVDNASSDRSVEDLEVRWPGVRVIRLVRNIGFSAANNLGAEAAQGRWLALLNNDAFPEPDWLSNLVEAAGKFPQFSFFASLMLQAKDKSCVDATGDVLHVSGSAWQRDHNRLIAQSKREIGEVFSACAAAALYDRKAFLEAGGFDESYFSHHEDVDLGFRLRLKGHRCLYVPSAVVTHIGSASFGVESDFTVYQVHRNLVWSHFSNMPGRLFWKYLPAHILANLVFLAYYTARGQARAIWSAKIDAIAGLPEALRKRRQVQRNRRVTPGEIAGLMDRGWLSPYLLGKRSGKIRRVARSPRFNRQ